MASSWLMVTRERRAPSQPSASRFGSSRKRSAGTVVPDEGNQPRSDEMRRGGPFVFSSPHRTAPLTGRRPRDQDASASCGRLVLGPPKSGPPKFLGRRQTEKLRLARGPTAGELGGAQREREEADWSGIPSVSLTPVRLRGQQRVVLRFRGVSCSRASSAGVGGCRKPRRTRKPPPGVQGVCA